MLTRKLIASAAMLVNLVSANAFAADSGNFTEAQASQGARLYEQHCAGCHGAKLEGAVGPALCGPAFIERSVQEGRSVDDLFFIVRTFMPYGKPGSLSKQQYVDVLAFVLKANGYRVGNKALPLDSAVLSRILISSANQ